MGKLAGVAEAAHQRAGTARSAGMVGPDRIHHIARPARRRGRSGRRLDRGADHRLAEAVIDHISAIMLGEGDRLLGARRDIKP